MFSVGSVVFWGLLGCSTPFVDVAHETNPSVDAVFQEAAIRYDVPRDLLVALSWSVSRLELDPGLHDHGQTAHGIMGLMEHTSTGPSLEKAAVALGVQPDVLMVDTRLNILGAAAELSAHGQVWAAENGQPLTTIEDWVHVVGWYSGIEHADLQRSFTEDVYATIRNGLVRRLSSGEWITIDARTLDLPGLQLQPLNNARSDYWATANFVAAHSNNHTAANRSASDIDTIVIHTAQGSYSGTASWFANPAAAVSAHYVVRSSDGEVTQMVWEDDVAWHAGDSDTNWRSIGIEQEGYVEYPDSWYTDAMYQSLASLIADICDRNNIPRDRQHIIAHSEVPGCPYGSGGGAGCHTDPGAGFDWDRLMALLGQTTSCTSSPSCTGSNAANTGSIVGYVRSEDLYDTHAGISGATVQLSTGEVATTDTDGWFSFAGVTAGDVSVQYSAADHQDATAELSVSTANSTWASVGLMRDSTAAPLDAYTPTGWQTVTGPDVTLQWNEAGRRYQIEVYHHTSSGWKYYYRYTTSSPALTFWPTVDDTHYAWAVRANDGGWQAWSALNYFFFDN